MKLGRLPVSYTAYREALQGISIEIEVGKIGTHDLPHAYRSWLGAEKTDADVQRRLMRHTDIRTTLSDGKADPEGNTASQLEGHSENIF